MKKGQMFIIAVIFMIVIIVLIKNMIGTVDISEESRFQESRYIDKQMKNIINEYRNVVGASSTAQDANQSGMEYLRNLSLLISNNSDASVFYMFIFVNGTDQDYTATFGNFLDDRVNITYNATNSNPSGTQLLLENKQNKTVEFTSSSGIVILNVTYLTGGKTTIEKFNITVSSNDQVFAYFDVTLRDRGFFVREKEVYNWTWPL